MARLPTDTDHAAGDAVPFFICAGAMYAADRPGTGWVSRCALLHRKPYRHLYDKACFIDDAGDICLLELHRGAPGGAMTAIAPLLGNPPLVIEDYATTAGEYVDLGPMRVRCRTAATLTRVRIPPGLPTNFRALIMKAGLQHDRIATAMRINYIEWRPLADHIRGIRSGDPRDIDWFREHTLQPLLHAGLVVDAESAALIVPQPESESVGDSDHE